MKRFDPRSRHKSRCYIVQALYQWQLAEDAPLAIEMQYREEFSSKADLNYFTEVFSGISQKASEIDEHFKPYLDRKIEELDPIEWAILRLSTFELLERIDVPYKVVINEAVELAKVFGAQDSHKYINGVMDKLAKILRPHETQSA